LGISKDCSITQEIQYTAVLGLCGKILVAGGLQG